MVICLALLLFLFTVLLVHLYDYASSASAAKADCQLPILVGSAQDFELDGLFSDDETDQKPAGPQPEDHGRRGQL